MPHSEKKKLINLYSSINFTDPKNTKTFGKWDKENKLKVLMNFVGEYTNNNQPNIYFKAKILLDAVVNKGSIVSKSNIVVKDICFKNEFNVSASSLTDEYKYLYDISCSSADNASSKSSKSSKSSSSELSLSDIYANDIEKQIMTNVKAFIESDAFKISWVLEAGFFTLDTTKYNPLCGRVTFPNVKMTIKYKLTGSSSSSHTSSCHSSSSSHKPNNFVKMLIIGFVALMIILFLFKLLKNNYYPEYSKSYNNVVGDVENIFSKSTNSIKSLFYKNEDYIPEPQHQKPVPPQPQSNVVEPATISRPIDAPPPPPPLPQTSQPTSDQLSQPPPV